MDPSTLIGPAIVAFITALFGSGVWSLIAQRRKTAAEVKTEEEHALKVKAETADLIRASAGELVVAYKQQTEELKAELKQVKERLRAVENELSTAHTEIKRLLELNKQLNRRLAGLEK